MNVGAFQQELIEELIEGHGDSGCSSDLTAFTDLA
jgi:hypothetical protein